jgi:selenium metabolism protein YedF
MTKKALKHAAEGDALEILIDNPTSMENVTRFLHDNGHAVDTHQEGQLFTMYVTKGATARPQTDPAAYCPTCSTGNAAAHVICLKSKTMGSGDEQLGTILLKACVNTIADVAPMPSAVICYNAGVFHALDDSPVLETLQKLEQQGVDIVVCGTCTDFYGVTDRVAVGTVSNMYTILELLSNAGSVVYP